VNDGFDFTHHIRLLCKDIVARLEPLNHIDMSRVAVSFSQARLGTRQGVYATLTPLRFPGGRLHTVRSGRKWGMQKVKDHNDREMLYILNFYLPRFLNLPLREKLDTVVHELWHIGEKCDGDLRRFGPRFFAHGPSKKKFDKQVAMLVDQWLDDSPPKAVYDFLHYNFNDLESCHGRIIGSKFPVPKMFRVD
jgi:predicted metallopeptidase